MIIGAVIVSDGISFAMNAFNAAVSYILQEKKITVFGNRRMMGYRLKVHGRATQWIFFHLKKKKNLYYINPV